MKSAERDALITASGWVLTSFLPENFVNWKPDERDAFLKEHAAGDYANGDAYWIWREIHQLSQMLITFHKNQLLKQAEEIKNA